MNILMFGPNGSGKGTQGALIKKAFGLAHIESGAIFREHVGGGTELGKKAKDIWIAENSSLTPSPFPWSSKP